MLRPLKWYKKLATMKGRLEAGAFLVEGHRAIKQVISNHPGEVLEIVTTQKVPSSFYRDYSIRTVSHSQFCSICSTRTPQGTAAVVRLPSNIYSEHLPQSIGAKILLLEDIQDPANVGTIVRTAVAFDFSGVILTNRCADPLSPKCVQSTAGTVLSVWIRRTIHYLEHIQALQKDGYALVAADVNGVTQPSILSQQDKLLLALGNEASGLSKAILDMANYRLRIPIAATKAESLNVSACSAIAMYLSSIVGTGL